MTNNAEAKTYLTSDGRFPINLNQLDNIDYVQSESSYGNRCPFKHDPSDYLNFAREDLRDNSDRGWLNAFHNAKRALDSQMDFILWNLGLERSDMNSPQKLATLSKVGASSVSILQRLIRQRNLLEHEYEATDLTAATDATDIAELFIRATVNISDRRHDLYKFWSIDSKTGGEIQFCLGDSDLHKLERDIPWLLGNSIPEELAPIGIHYSIYKSIRTDDEDPLDLFEWCSEVQNLPLEERIRKLSDFGFESLGKGIVYPAHDELYCSLVRIMVRGMREDI